MKVTHGDRKFSGVMAGVTRHNMCKKSSYFTFYCMQIGQMEEPKQFLIKKYKFVECALIYFKTNHKGILI